jgi:hypothetical protein
VQLVVVVQLVVAVAMVVAEGMRFAIGASPERRQKLRCSRYCDTFFLVSA